MGGMQDTGTHVLEIFRAAEGQSSRRDADVLASWRRCVNEHRLDPTRHLGPRIVTQGELRQHRQESEELLGMARHGMEDLYRRVNTMGYVLLLSNARGVTVDAIGDAELDRELRHAGLIAGSEWHESHVGTNGVGACLATGRAITVHRTDHFDLALTPLSCTAVPIHDTQGNLMGVLDLSHLHAPQDKISQALTLEVMKSCARRIEMANLVCNHRSDWILRLHPSPEFLDVDPMAAVAVGADGRITGMTHNAHELVNRDLIGRPFSEVFAHEFEDLPVLSYWPTRDIGPALLLLTFVVPAPEGLSELGWRTAGVAALMAAWWICEPIPIPATSLLPMALFPLLGIVEMRGAAAPYAHPIIYLFFGGFLLALAMERWGLHRRIALGLIGFMGTRPTRIIAGFMIASAFLSMWVSNTATALMMLPIAISVIAPHFVSDRPADLAALAITLFAATRLPLLATVVIGVCAAGLP